MATSDGISSEDWERVHELAVDLVNADGDDEDLCRHKLLAHLDALEAKYGPRPSILATRADYIQDDIPARIGLFRRAYAAAIEAIDVRNELHIALSLAAIYVEELQDAAEGSQWLSSAREHLGRAGTDVDQREYDRVMAGLERLQSRP